MGFMDLSIGWMPEAAPQTIVIRAFGIGAVVTQAVVNRTSS
jgi:hypothetical protein